MISKKLKVVLLIDIILLSIISIYNHTDHYIGYDYNYFDGICFTLQTVIYVAIIAHWAIRVYERVMQKNIRNNLIAMAILSVMWFLMRNIKYRAFEFLGNESRFMWYLFYIPMIFIPICGFLVALILGKDEKYKPNKKWNLLNILGIIFICIVLTNDIHQLVFAFEFNFENWDTNYKYSIFYPTILTFISLIIVFTAFTIFKKWRKINRPKNAYLPLVVLGSGIVYITIYIFNRPIASLFTDVTTFNVLFNILFWESCIQVGLIGSNSNHNVFLKHSKVGIQILNKKGTAHLMSLQATPINKEEFITLKEKGYLEQSKDNILQIAPITNGYVAWENDISKLNAIKNELTELRDELYGEVVFLEEEQKLKEKQARVKKLNNLYDMITAEILPQMKNIEILLEEAKTKNEQTQDSVLKKINLISCYIKRKTNLLLQIDSDNPIKNKDMINCYNESFRGVGLFGTGCHINYNPPENTSADIHILCYDLFQEVLEKVGFNLDMVFVNCIEDDKNLRFSVDISSSIKLYDSDFNKFKQEQLKKTNGYIFISHDDDNQGLKVLFPKKGESDLVGAVKNINTPPLIRD